MPPVFCKVGVIILISIPADSFGIIDFITSHTDMTGTAEYNKDLSLKRAESAREYIVSTYNIQQDRISVSGFGFEHLADRQDPYSGANRRVEVIKLSE